MHAESKVVVKDDGEGTESLPKTDEQNHVKDSISRDREYIEFWAPIRKKDPLFKGEPISCDWLRKDIKKVHLELYVLNHDCYVKLVFRMENRLERRDEVMKLFPKSEYSYEYRKAKKSVSVRFPVLNKGKEDRGDWNEIREKLVNMGSNIYNRIKKSNLQ